MKSIKMRLPCPRLPLIPGVPTPHPTGHSAPGSQTVGSNAFKRHRLFPHPKSCLTAIYPAPHISPTNPLPATLAAPEIQTPFYPPTPVYIASAGIPDGPFVPLLPPFSPHREFQTPFYPPTPVISLSGNSQRSYSYVPQAGPCHFSPHRESSGPFAPQPPSFSPQRESRALTMRQHGNSNREAPGGRANIPPGPSQQTRIGWMGKRAFQSRNG